MATKEVRHPGAEAQRRRDAGEGTDPEGYAERRSRLAAEIGDWYRRAYDAFVEKKGREPLSDQDVIEAEELAGLPERYRTGGDDVQALVVVLVAGMSRGEPVRYRAERAAAGEAGMAEVLADGGKPGGRPALLPVAAGLRSGSFPLRHPCRRRHAGVVGGARGGSRTPTPLKGGGF